VESLLVTVGIVLGLVGGAFALSNRQLALREARRAALDHARRTVAALTGRHNISAATDKSVVHVERKGTRNRA
jgi:hypothetical protein